MVFDYYTNVRKEVKNIFLSSDENKKEKKYGFLNPVEQFLPRICCKGSSVYINILFFECKATDAQSGRVPTLRVGSSQGIQVQNSFSFGAESLVCGVQKEVSHV